MAWTFTCECGAQLDAATEEALVDAARRHVAEAHPKVGVAPSAADVLAIAECAAEGD